MSGSVCVVGSFMMDLVAYAPRRPHAGETLIGTGFSSAPGGKGFNQAVAAARAGARTSMVGCVGDDDMGAQFRTMLAAEGIDATAVTMRPGAGTGVGLPLVEPGGQNSIVVVPRANRGVDAAQIVEAAPVIVDANVLVLQLELDVEAAVAAARIAHERGVTVILNPAPVCPLPAELLEHVDVLVPNEGELAALTGRPGVDPGEAAAALRQQWGLDVVVTLGERGALVVAAGGPVHVPARSVTAVDTVGAGDVFCGYLAAGLAQGLGLAQAAEVANAAAAISVTRTGSAASAPTADEVSELASAPSAVATGH
jgi:ribokinase